MEHCTVHTAKIDNMKEAVKDPALSSLLASGWTVVSTIVISTDSDTTMNMVLAPPNAIVKGLTRAVYILAAVAVISSIVSLGLHFG